MWYFQHACSGTVPIFERLMTIVVPISTGRIATQDNACAADRDAKRNTQCIRSVGPHPRPRFERQCDKSSAAYDGIELPELCQSAACAVPHASSSASMIAFCIP